MAVTFYDNLPLNQGIVLDWPMTEGTGKLVHDQSKSGSIGQLLTGGLPVMWPAAIGTGFYGVYLFEVWDQYINCPAVDTTNLNFTSGDYSLACWFRWSIVEYSQILMGKYILDDSGWEVYLTNAGGLDYVSVRHHHSLGATARTSSYSTGWPVNILHCWSYSRTGTTAQHYRNGLPVTTTSSVLIDPESSVGNDLRLGVRFTEGANWFNGYLGRPRAWNRALTAAEHRQIYAQGNAQ